MQNDAGSKQNFISSLRTSTLQSSVGRVLYQILARKPALLIRYLGGFSHFFKTNWKTFSLKSTICNSNKLAYE